MSECPTCGRTFDSNTGMKIHHKSAHGESISGFEKVCKNCGDTFIAPQRSREYCKQSCVGKDLFKGSGNPSYKGGRKTTVQCEWCGREFEDWKTRADDRRFCSRECSGKHRSRLTGEDNPTYKSITVECETCGSEFHKQPHAYKATDNHFCNHSCFAVYLSENQVGENHPSWKGGHDADYGDNWHQQREKCIKRDDARCQSCGITREQHIETFNADLHAHHVIPKRRFENVESANDLGNLVTLCRECHPKWENIPVAPKLRD